MQPTIWILPEISRFVPRADQARLLSDVGETCVSIIAGVGHSIHRDTVESFVDVVLRLACPATILFGRAWRPTPRLA